MKNDHGGATNSGVTIAVFQSVYGKNKTKNDLKRMTDEQWDYIFTKKRKILSARRQNIEAIGYTAEKKFAAPKHRFEIYGRIGAGDAFAAGAIAGLLLNYEDGKKALDYGTANCILKQSISGDQSKFTVEDLERYLSSAGPGEVIR